MPSCSKRNGVIRHKNGTPLFEGPPARRRVTVEAAVAQGVSLEGGELRGIDLSGANLDGADFRGADFRGANFTGVNLSEARLDGADFRGATLYNTCLCESALRGCDFTDADFGGTDIAGADLTGCIFSTLSAFSLNFVDCAAMEGCVFVDPQGVFCPFSWPPVVIAGLSRPIVLLDRHIKTGARVLDYRTWLASLRLAEAEAESPLHAFERRDAVARLALSIRRERAGDEKFSRLRAASGQGG